MELLALVRVLWHHRILVAIGAVGAMAVGLIGTQAGGSHFGVASARVVLDTRKSQLLDVRAKGVDSLAWRAALLADLTGSREMTARIARDMHVREDSLVVIAPYLAVPRIATPLPRHAADAASVTAEPYVLAVQADDGLPIVKIDARAPDAAEATRLATAATDALRAAASAPERTPETADVMVESVGPIRARQIVSRPRRLVALGVAAVVFGFWCACVALFARLRRSWGGPAELQPVRISGR